MGRHYVDNSGKIFVCGIILNMIGPRMPDMYCLECAERLEIDLWASRSWRVWSDSPPHADESCDSCSRVLNTVRVPQVW